MKFSDPWQANVYCRTMEVHFKERFNIAIFTHYDPEKDKIKWDYVGETKCAPKEALAHGNWVAGFEAGYGVRK